MFQWLRKIFGGSERIEWDREKVEAERDRLIKAARKEAPVSKNFARHTPRPGFMAMPGPASLIGLVGQTPKRAPVAPTTAQRAVSQADVDRERRRRQDAEDEADRLRRQREDDDDSSSLLTTIVAAEILSSSFDSSSSSCDTSSSSDSFSGGGGDFSGGGASGDW